MLKNGKTKAIWGLHFFGCSCCNSKQSRRRAKKSMKSKEKQQTKKEINDRDA